MNSNVISDESTILPFKQFSVLYTLSIWGKHIVLLRRHIELILTF